MKYFAYIGIAAIVAFLLWLALYAGIWLLFFRGTPF